MKYRRVMIAAPKSGSGKTMITCALLWALKDRGEKTVSFKCGPDYIDPMFHEKAMGISAGNLDTFFTDEEQTRRLFMDGAGKDTMAVLEGVMGVFDGLGGVREEGSSYHLARTTGTPIILVADVKGMGRSVIPFLAGFLAYDRERLIRGVILNRMSEGYFKIIKPLIEDELEIPVLGYFPERKELGIESRHLGLVMPDEMRDIREKLREASEQLERTVSVDLILEIARGGKELDEGEDGGLERKPGDHREEGPGREPGGRLDEEMERRLGDRQERKQEDADGKNGKRPADNKEDCSRRRQTAIRRKPVIGIARDEAFCFYYRENLRMLEEYGAELIWFSPIHDERVPDKCHGLLLGGGYPELYAGKLSENEGMRDSVRQAIKKGMPVVAECGGFMYLHEELVGRDGIRFAMAGALPVACFYTGRLVRFGYIEIEEKRSIFLPEGERIKGHEFHYYDSTDNGSGAVAIKPATGKTYSCIVENENCWMGFPHLYYPSNGGFVRKFIEKIII